MSQDATPRPANRLIHETSPYLLQHAHNPVDWYPWGREALARARQEGRPILLSIGYSACHWCHVMERESFEDFEIARLMNESFVCVKVDREERPDLDEIYMNATQMLNQGQGGWPMTVFLTPDQEPFFAGTYFPPTDRWGRPGFGSILKRIAAMWTNDQRSIRSQAAQLTRMLQQETAVDPGLSVGLSEIDAAAAQLRAAFDEEDGGFGRAPKFPPAIQLRLLLRHHARTGNRRSLEMVTRTLEAMARGGIYDQVGGGFARYSTDDRWLVPHFEKMLYDNALLARAYLEGFQATGLELHARIVRETCDYVLREMTGAQGAFHSSTDADSEGEEGKFFVWTLEQVQQALDPDEARAFAAYYDVSVHGNWDGKSVLNVPRSTEDVATELGISAERLAGLLTTARAKIQAERARRVPPGLDDKVLTGWNGLMIGALAEASRVLFEPRYLVAARRCAEFLLTTLRRPDGRMLRTARAGKAHLAGVLEDHAYLADALLDLAEAGGGDRWLEDAGALARVILADFGPGGGSAEASGGLYATGRDAEALLVRSRTGIDGATPAANAVAAQALARLSHHTGDATFRQAAIEAIGAHGRAIAGNPRAHAMSLLTVDFLLHGPVELVFVGCPGSPDLTALMRAASRTFLPRRVIAHLDPRQAQADAPAPSAQAPERPPGSGAGGGRPLLAGKALIDGHAALHVCRAGECLVPVTDPGAVSGALESAVRAAPERRTIGKVLGGFATGAATADLARRHGAGRDGSAYGPLGRTGLVVSRLGFGGYRIHEDSPTHAKALGRALLAGINLIDTSTNYADGGSERLVGRVLAQLVAAGQLRREEVVVVSKIGYIQGENMRWVAERAATGIPFPEVVEYMDGCWHCIHPEFLADQLDRSLARLGLETLDLCLLHNPEYFLADSAKRGAESIDATREEFYERLRDAFAYFESQVAAGRIRAYGVSSNSVAEPSDGSETTDLARMLDAARQAGGPDHHFRVLQLPMNLLESSPLFERNTGEDGARTPLDLAALERVAILVNRPLNAAAHEAMMRLADSRPPAGEPIDLAETLADLARLEDEFRRVFAPQIQVSGGRMRPDQFFAWSQQLKGVMDHIQSPEHWRDMERQMVRPQLESVLEALDEAMQDQAARAWRAWRDRYVPLMERLLLEISRRAVEKGRGPKDTVLAALDPLLPPERRAEPLSRKALWVLESTPGVSCVLLGMREAAYVDDALATLAWPPLPDVERIFRTLRPR